MDRARLLLVSSAPALLVATLLGGSADAQPKTDVVRLLNGDRITGEVIALERGRLQLKTDDAGTIYIEWDNVGRIEATRQFEVGTTDGRRFLGRFAPSAEGSIAVEGPDGIVELRMAEVTLITPIGASLWKRLDGSFDAGFSYTKSSGIAQLNVNSDTVYRRPGFEGRLAASLTVTGTEEGNGRDDRASLEASYVRYRWPRAFVSAAARFETNESLGLRLRSQLGGAVGPRLVNTNRAQVLLGGGLVINDERGVDVAATQNVEALAMFASSYYTYDRPRTTLDAAVQYYPSLSDPGRHRLQLDTGVNRELWRDFFLALNVYDTFDSRPPNASADTNDVGVVLSIGWSY